MLVKIDKQPNKKEKRKKAEKMIYTNYNIKIPINIAYK